MTTTVEDLKSELKDLMHSAFEHAKRKPARGCGKYKTLDQLYGQRARKLAFIISEHEETSEDLVMLALRYQSE